MKVFLFLLVSAVLLDAQKAVPQSLDLASGGYGLSFGNSRRITGIRVNLVDHQVERVIGLNLTLWTPRGNPNAHFRGISVGLIGPKARQIDGITLGGIGVSATEDITGVALGGIGVKARNLTGLSAGLVWYDVEERIRGIAVAGMGEVEKLEGVAFSLVQAVADTVLGVTAGGLFASGSSQLNGTALSLGVALGGNVAGGLVGGIGAGGEHVRGFALGGVCVVAQDLDGVGASLGFIYADNRLRGIAVGGLGVAGSEMIRGIAFGSLFVFSKDVRGVTAGALNGFVLEEINLEDFLRFKFINDRYTGLSIGLINYTRRLKGVQFGLLNYAENNPRGLRLLPLINLHL